MPSIESLLNEATCRLKNAPQLSQLDIRARLESEILLAHALGVSRVYLHTHSLESISQSHKARFLRLISRRTKAEPIEYITHKASFYGRAFFVNQSVLIPRPESEILIDVALEWIKSHHILRVVEVGVGSGILSITLSLFCKKISFLATDISLKALKIANKNITAFGCENRIQLCHSDMFKSIHNEILDFSPELLIANPPYIKKSYILPAPLKYEPSIALFGGQDGLDMIKQLITQAKQRQIPLICEIGYNQRENIENLLRKAHFPHYQFFKDLSGLWRVFLANPKANY